MSVDQEHAAELQEMWDRWWYDRFEISNDIQPEWRRFELEVDGQVFGGVLLESAAPRTCDAFYKLLPFSGDIIHNAWFGHCSYFLDRFPQIVDELGFELENRQVELAPGDFIWDPWLEEITWAYGRFARMRFPTTIHTDRGGEHPNHGTIFARVIENLDGFAAVCKSLRYEGYKVMEVRPAE
jgi:hypothetical protein